MPDLDILSRDELVKLVEVYARNWLAHDGCWFLAIEERFGIDVAIEMDMQSWERFSPAEARRIMQTFDVSEGSGLDGLERALRYRLYANVNQQMAEWIDAHTLEFRMIECHVQAVRRRKGLPDFPCKSVGIVEYSQFSSTVDPRIETACVACPPDITEGAFCIWRFTIRE